MSKKEHHSRYARIRRNNPVEIIKIPSPKVNWDVVEQLKMNVKPLRKKDKTDE
jgi:hypothetical protein